MSDSPPTSGGHEPANPYIAGSPVTVPEMFYGREDVFYFVGHALVGRHRDNAIVLYGQRRTGKTSILHQLQHHLGPRYVCVFVDLHALALDGLGGALWELAASVNRVLRREYQIDLPLQDRAEFLLDPRTNFESTFLGKVLEAIVDRHLVLMLDEVVRLQEQVEAGKIEKDIFVYLRHLMQHNERLTFLFSLGSGLEEMSKEYALLFNVALYKKISFLDRDAAVALVRHPVEDLYEVEPDAVERVLEITSGHPYFTQLICHGLFNRWQRTRAPRVGRIDVDAVLDEAVERGLAVLKHVWEDSTPGEKAVLAAIAALSQGASQAVHADAIADVWNERGAVLPVREVVSAIQSLTARDVLVGREAYVFAVDLQRRWIRHYRRVEWVQEEISAPLAEWSEARAAASVTPAPTAPAPPSRARPMLMPWVAVALAGLAILVAGFATWQNWQRPDPTVPTPVATGRPESAPREDAARVNGLAVAAGAVWAATDGGLVRWTPDGTWQVLAEQDGMDFGFPDDGRQTLAVANDGTLWIGGGGVAQVNVSGRDRPMKLWYYERTDGLGIGAVRVLYVDTDGSVWAGGSHDPSRPPPLSHFDGKPGPNGQPWRTLDVPIADPSLAGLALSIRSIFRGGDGSLWLGLDRDGILRWDGASWTHFGAAPSVAGDCTNIRVRSIAADRGGTLWAAAECQGLLHFNAALERWQRVMVGQQGRVNALARFADGSLWIAGPGLVARSEDNGQNWTTVGSATDGVGMSPSSIVEGPDGHTWIGDYGGGVSVLEGSQWRHLQR